MPNIIRLTMSKLYIIPTPIGNLEDITLRALRILKEVDLVLAEDTRQTLKLFHHYQIEKPLYSFHMHNEHHKLPDYIHQLKQGKTIALVSDAGTPGISDPGFLIVRECVKEGIKVECLPGATAFVPALVASGLPCDTFIFQGFLPVKKGRQTIFKALTEEEKTIVIYESPHKLNKTLKDLETYFKPNTQVVVVREISKIYEEFVRGNIAEVKAHFEKIAPRGEIVLLIKNLS